MKALSVKQPYAALLATGQKTLEVRSMRTNYRGPVVICASKKLHVNYDYYNVYKGVCYLLSGDKGFAYDIYFDLLHYSGQAIAVADLVDVRLMRPDDESLAGCEYACGFYVWVFENPRLIEPQYITGRLGIFELIIEPKFLEHADCKLHHKNKPVSYRW